MAIRLEEPHAALLDSYQAALRTGWSPSTTHDLSGRQLAAIAADARAFLADYEWAPGKTITLPNGQVVPRLAGQTYWITDHGAVCGSINLRYQPGTIDLPPYVSGHIGYTVIPEKRRQGIATAALRALLPIAHAAGLPVVTLTADPDNIPSQRVILAAGGHRIADQSANEHFDHLRWAYAVPTA